jgi:hypothetical protein
LKRAVVITVGAQAGPFRMPSDTYWQVSSAMNGGRGYCHTPQ